MCIWNCFSCRFISGNPLCCTSGRLCLLPLVLKERLKVGVIPCRWSWCPSTFEAARNSFCAISLAIGVLPTKTHLFDRRTFWFCTNIFSWICRTMCFTECMSTGNECNGLFIIHSHTSKCFANIFCRCKNIRISIWTFRVYINQTHLHCSKWIF